MGIVEKVFKAVFSPPKQKALPALPPPTVVEAPPPPEIDDAEVERQRRKTLKAALRARGPRQTVRARLGGDGDPGTASPTLLGS